jgi:hypothetical protein
MTCRAYLTATREFHGYSWRGILPYTTNSTTECLTASGESRSFPTNVPLPTQQVEPLDPNDPRGLGYCYDHGLTLPVTDAPFWSLFEDTVLDTLHNKSNCKQVSHGVGPAVVATQATFLLETTTDFIDGPETDSPTPLHRTEATPTPTEVLVDPFQTKPQSEDEQKSSWSKSDVEPEPTNVSASSAIAEPIKTRPAPDRTTPLTKQSLIVTVLPADDTNPPSRDENEPKPSESRNARPTELGDEVSESRVPEATASANEISGPDDKPAPAPKTGQLEVLNSLIQDVGQHQHQSSVGPAAFAGENAPTITFNGITATPGSSSEYVIGKQTLEAGGPAIIISGTQVSLASGASAIVVGSSTSMLLASDSPGDLELPNGPAPVLTLTANSNSASEYVVGDQTLKPGGPAITISGTPVSMDPRATALVVGSSTRPIAVVPYREDQSHREGAQLAGSPPARLTLAGTTATLNSASGYIIAGQTLRPGGTAITVSGTPISLASQATAVIVGSSTIPLAVAPNRGDQDGARSPGTLPPSLTLAGTTATLNSASEYIIAGQTLEPGGPAITVSGTPITLAAQATAVVVGSSTSMLATTPHAEDQEQQTEELVSVLTLAGATATLNSASEYVFEGQTLTPGANAITVSGTRISLAPHATAVVIGSTSSALAVASTNIGDYVWAGIAGVLAAAGASSTASPGASETKSGSEVIITSTASDGEVVVETLTMAETTSAVASKTKSGSEVIVTSTASDGEVVVETIFTADSTTSSPIDFSSSTAGAPSLASGEAPSTSSSSSPSGISDAASAASFTKSVVDVTALVFWMGVVTMFSM